MKVLITGGTGFVGRPLVERGLREGWEIRLLSRQPDPFPSPLHPYLKIYPLNVTDKAGLEAMARQEKAFDAVIHLAALVDYFGETEALRQTNVEGTRHMLHIAAQTGARKFIYASSIEAVGSVRRGRVPARAKTPCRPISAYGQSKVEAEKLVLALSGRFPAVILRIGNVYGPGHSNFIIEMAQALLARSGLLEFLPVYGDRVVQPAFSEDVTEGIMAALRCETTAVVTLAGEYATVRELFEMCGDVVHRRVPRKPRLWRDVFFLTLRCAYHRSIHQLDSITYLMASPWWRRHRACSLDSAKTLLGWEPQTPLKKGIAETLVWAKQSGRLSF